MFSKRLVKKSHIKNKYIKVFLSVFLDTWGICCLPWLFWARHIYRGSLGQGIHFTFSKIMKIRLENTRPRRILCSPMKLCVTVCFLTYFPKSIFQHFGNWRLRKIHIHTKFFYKISRNQFKEYKEPI